MSLSSRMGRCLGASLFFLLSLPFVSLGAAEPPRLLWRAPLPEGVSIPMGVPAIDGHRLYAVAGGVRSWDARTGQPLWTAPLVEHAPRNLAVAGGRVLVAESVALALDAETGQELWRVALEADASLGRSAAADGAFYFGTSAHRVHALRAADGAHLWSTDVGPEWTFPAVVRGVTVDRDAVYAAVDQWRSVKGEVSSGWLIALDRRTGKVLWRYENGGETGQRGASSPPVAAGNLLLASDRLGNAVLAVDRATGREIWRFAGERGFLGFPDPPAVIDGRVHAASGDARAYALDLQSGKLLRSIRLPAGAFAHAACGSAFFVNYQGLATIDPASGALVDRRLDGEAEFLSSGFAERDGRLYVLGSRGIYALECPSG